MYKYLTSTIKYDTLLSVYKSECNPNPHTEDNHFLDVLTYCSVSQIEFKHNILLNCTISII